MNRLLLLLFIAITPYIGMAQTARKTQTSATNAQNKEVIALLSKIDTLVAINNELLNQLNVNTSLKGRYKLYQTDNIYNLLELDTKTGKIKQVQWSLNADNEGSLTINDEDLSYGYGSGSFELYPTKNMYQFILIDKTDGRKWHVQWGMKSSEQWIRRIY